MANSRSALHFPLISGVSAPAPRTIAAAFAQDTAEAARQQWRQVADQLRAKVPKLAAMMDEANNPIERLNGEIKRRADVVGANFKMRISPSPSLPNRRDDRITSAVSTQNFR